MKMGSCGGGKVMVILFANEILLKHNGVYYAETLNFTDECARLALKSDLYKFVFYCKKASASKVRGLPKLKVPDEISEIRYFGTN